MSFKFAKDIGKENNQDQNKENINFDTEFDNMNTDRKLLSDRESP